MLTWSLSTTGATSFSSGHGVFSKYCSVSLGKVFSYKFKISNETPSVIMLRKYTRNFLTCIILNFIKKMKEIHNLLALTLTNYTITLLLTHGTIRGMQKVWSTNSSPTMATNIQHSFRKSQCFSVITVLILVLVARVTFKYHSWKITLLYCVPKIFSWHGF